MHSLQQVANIVCVLHIEVLYYFYLKYLHM